MRRFDPAGPGKGFYREEWNLGVVDQPAEDIARRGIVAPIRWLPPLRPWKMLADPWCRDLPGGRLVVLAARLAHCTGRGANRAPVLGAGADDALGATALAKSFQFLRGSTVSGSYQYLTVANPGSSATEPANDTNGLPGMRGVKVVTGAAAAVLLMGYLGPTPALADTIEAALVRAYQHALSLLQMIAWPITVAVVVLAGELIGLLGGQEYRPGAAQASRREPDRRLLSTPPSPPAPPPPGPAAA